jgi:hypothetical protein
MHKHPPLWTFESTTPLTIDQIESRLFDLKEGEYNSDKKPFLLRNKAGFKISKENSTYTIEFKDGHKEYIELDPAGHSIRIRGMWWYQGVYTAHAHLEGTMIRLEVYNIARSFRWAASLMVMKEKKKHEKMFHDCLRELKAVCTNQ